MQDLVEVVGDSNVPAPTEPSGSGNAGLPEGKPQADADLETAMVRHPDTPHPRWGTPQIVHGRSPHPNDGSQAVPKSQGREGAQKAQTTQTVWAAGRVGRPRWNTADQRCSRRRGSVGTVVMIVIMHPDAISYAASHFPRRQ